MNMIRSLVELSDRYCTHAQLSRSRLSTIIFNDGKALARIADGGDLNTRSYEKAMTWLSANWPEGVAWPEGVERPGAPDVVDKREGAAA